MLKAVVVMVGCMVLPTSYAVASAMHGKELYEQNCASCHGMDGKVSELGKALKPFPARDLTALAATVDRDELRRIIAYGIKGTDMVPKKYDLDAAGIEDVIDYILTFKRKVDMKNGKKRFEQVCATCHGVDGRAKTGMGAKNLVYSDLTLKETVHTIRYGRPGTKMSGKRHQLSNPDIEDIANYVHELRFKADANKGEKIFVSTCKTCHASPSAIRLVGNRAHQTTIAELNDYVLDLRIRHGRHIHLSRKAVKKLSEDDAQDLIAYLRQETQ